MPYIEAYRTPRRPDDAGPEPRRPEKWHVGKEVPLALVLSILMSVASGVWYASATSARISVIEKTIEGNALIREDIVQLKEQLKNLDHLVMRFEAVLDRRAEIDGGKTDRGMLQP